MIRVIKHSLLWLLLILSYDALGQSFEEKLRGKGHFNRPEIEQQVAFDSLPWYVSKRSMYVDTTVVRSDLILFSVVSFGDTAGVSSIFYLITVDRQENRVLDLRFLKTESDIDQSAKSFEWFTHHILEAGVVEIIKYECNDPTRAIPDECFAIGRRTWQITEEGRIIGGAFEPIED